MKTTIVRLLITHNGEDGDPNEWDWPMLMVDVLGQAEKVEVIQTEGDPS